MPAFVAELTRHSIAITSTDLEGLRSFGLSSVGKTTAEVRDAA
jgi:hypothetical protein